MAEFKKDMLGDCGKEDREDRSVYDMFGKREPKRYTGSNLKYVDRAMAKYAD